MRNAVFVRLAMLATLATLAGACANGEPSKPTSSNAHANANANANATAAPTTATTVAVQAGDTFGSAISAQTPFVALADLVRDPKPYDGKHVRTRGEVVAVCQNAGCWADLRPEGAPDAVIPAHVTMHQHAFFLPKTAKTKLAEIEGTISVRALTQDECDHFDSEGASLVAGTPVVGVDATGVVLR